MTVRLMLTCLCDAFYGDVGISTVRVLEHAGCTVQFNPEQTCCGQPPFNAGDWETARTVAKHWQSVFTGDQVVVTPSGSCAAMVEHGYSLLYKDFQRPKTYELSAFLINVLGISKWPLSGNKVATKRKIALHRSCHGRMTGATNEQESLCRMIKGVELIPFGQDEQCCGFGGAFSATHGKISEGIGLTKLQSILDSGAREIVSADMGCLMHLQGLIERHELHLKTSHVAQLLAGAIEE